MEAKTQRNVSPAAVVFWVIVLGLVLAGCFVPVHVDGAPHSLTGFILWKLLEGLAAADSG